MVACFSSFYGYFTWDSSRSSIVHVEIKVFCMHEVDEDMCIIMHTTRVLHDVKRTGGGRPKAYQLSGRRPRRGESTRGGCPPCREKFFENKTVNNAFSWHLRTDFYKIARPNLNANPSVFRCKPTAPTTHWR